MKDSDINTNAHAKSVFDSVQVLAYDRGGGWYGIRNHVLVVPTTFCNNNLANEIADAFRPFGPNGMNRVIAVNHNGGCCDNAGDKDMTKQTLDNLKVNPNVGAVLFVSLGCGQQCSEWKQPGVVSVKLKSYREPLSNKVTVQGRGGTRTALKQAVSFIKNFINSLEEQQRKLRPLGSVLFPGVMNGSSDPTSIFINRFVGEFLDLHIAASGFATFGQSVECLGAEQILFDRCYSEETSKKLEKVLTFHAEYHEVLKKQGLTSEPTPGNINSGIPTLSAKSAATLRKIGGSGSSLIDVLPFGTRVDKNKQWRSRQKPIRNISEGHQNRGGLYMIDSPGQDVLALSALTAAGCNLIFFTTGNGTPTGAPGVPTIKLTANSTTAENMADIIDFLLPVEDVFNRSDSFENILLKRFLPFVAKVINGTEKTKAEINRQADFQLLHQHLIA